MKRYSMPIGFFGMLGFGIIFFWIVPWFGLYLDRLIGFPAFITSWDISIGWGLLIIGIPIALSCVFPFIWVGKGTPFPLAPPAIFISFGLYRYTRNPMMWGAFLVFFGQSFLYRSWTQLGFFILILMPLMVWFVVNIEEPDLEKRFGESYRDYKSRVPRWGWKFKV